MRTPPSPSRPRGAPTPAPRSCTTAGGGGRRVRVHSDKIALKKLKQFNWNLDSAVESDLLEAGSAPGAVPKADRTKAQAFFEKYKGTRFAHTALQRPAAAPDGGPSWGPALQQACALHPNRGTEPDEDSILVDGVGQLCSDLGIDPGDVVMLILAWHLQAVRMCEFTRSQFVDGLCKLGYGTCARARARAYRPASAKPSLTCALGHRRGAGRGEAGRP